MSTTGDRGLPRILTVCTLTLLHSLVLTNLIGDRAATSTSSATNQSTLTTAQQTTNYGTTNSRASNNLRARMLLMVLRSLLALRTLVLCLLVLRHMVRSQLVILSLTCTWKSKT